VVCKEKQHRPTVTATDLGAILPGVKTKYAVLFSLPAGTGLRIGEALAVRPTDFGPDCRVLHVQRSIWRGQEQEPKTDYAVDIPETLACVLRSYVAGISGYLFATAQGKPLLQRNVLRVLHGVKRVGFHAFRRFALRGSERVAFRRTLNVSGWATHPKRSATCTRNSKTTFRSVKSGRNAPDSALSWYTLVHKTQLRFKL
jgi:integrase